MKIIVIDKAFDGGAAVYPNVEYGPWLSDLVERYVPQPAAPVEVLVNGVKIQPSMLSHFRPSSVDTIIIRPRVGFMIPLPAMFAFLGPVFMAAGPYIMSALVALIGGLIVRALTGKPSPTDTGAAPIWNAHTMQTEGIPLPRYYGCNRVYGNIIGAWRTVAQSNHAIDPIYARLTGASGANSYGGAQKLNLLIDLGEGPVEGIVAGSVRINEQNIVNFSGVSCEEKKGTLNQTACAGMTELPVEYAPDILVTMAGGAQIYTMPVRDMDVVNVGIVFQKGLNRIKKGSSKLRTVRVKIELAEAGTGIWNTLFDSWLTAKTLRPIYAMYRNTGTYDGGAAVDISGWDGVDIRITKVDTTNHADGDNSTANFDELRLSVVHAVYSTAFTFPKSSYVYITALPSNKLSGTLKFDCLQDGAIVNTYDGASWTLQYSDNPAWVLLDLATQPVITGSAGSYAIDRYLGLDPAAQVDLDSVYALAQFCDGNANDGEGGVEKRFVFGGGIVQQSDAWRTLLSICDATRCVPVWDGQKLSFVIDQTNTTPVQLFNVANIIKDSFKQTYTAQTDRASEIEVRYRDEDQDYASQSITVVDAVRESEGRAVALDLLYGTRQSEAWRYGYFKLLQNRLLLRTIEFGVDVEGLLCAIGDSFYFQHDTVEPTSLLGGRVVSSTDNTIVVNRGDCNLAGALKVLVRVYDPSTGTWAFEDHSVNTVSGTTITISDTWTLNPKVDDPFIVGVTTSYKKQYAVTGLQFQADKTVTVSAVEYNAGVYAADTDAPDLQATGTTAPLAVGSHVALPTLDDVRTVTLDGGNVALPDDNTVVINVTWTSDDPGAGSISWTHTDADYPIEVRYNDTLYPVDDGDTNSKYIYWKLAAPNVLSATNTLSDIAAASGVLLQINVSGTAAAVLDSYNLTASLVNQDVKTTASPAFAGLTVGTLSGVLKAAAGAVSGSADHANLANIGADDHHATATVAAAPLTISGQQITFNYDTNDFQLSGNNLQVKDGGIAHDSTGGVHQAVGTTAEPTFAGLVITDGTSSCQFSPSIGTLLIRGPAVSLTTGPKISLMFNSDADAVLSFFAYSHDNTALVFDSWHDGATWVSSHSTSNFALYKNVDMLFVAHKAGVAKGSRFTGFDTSDGVRFDINGRMGVGIVPLEQIHAADTVRADTAFNLNGADGVTQAASAGKVSDVTALAGGIATAQTQITYATDGTYNFDATSGKVSSITITNGRITGITTAA